jgi:arsenite methyltransferase
MKKEEIKPAIRERYGAISVNRGEGCGCSPAPVAQSSCCGTAPAEPASFTDKFSKAIGYSDEDLKSVPDGANLGLGCGNPVALASLKEGEVVLDLGSGGGFDCFLAAGKVGKTGRVIGVDMTPAMLDRARQNAASGGYTNVEFRMGEIENLPVADSQVDAIISNCVINLSPDKDRVFQEAYRVLKPGGRLMVSDMVLLGKLPDKLMESADAYVHCIGGASLKSDYLGAIEKAGFRNVEIKGELSLPATVPDDPMIKGFIESSGLNQSDLIKAMGMIKSIKVQAFKPA